MASQYVADRRLHCELVWHRRDTCPPIRWSLKYDGMMTFIGNCQRAVCATQAKATASWRKLPTPRGGGEGGLDGGVRGPKKVWVPKIDPAFFLGPFDKFHLFPQENVSDVGGGGVRRRSPGRRSAPPPRVAVSRGVRRPSHGRPQEVEELKAHLETVMEENRRYPKNLLDDLASQRLMMEIRQLKMVHAGEVRRFVGFGLGD